MAFRFRAPVFVEVFDRRVDQAFEPLRSITPLNRLAYVASESAHYSMCWHAAAAAIAVVRPDLRGRAVRMAVTLGIESVLVNGIVKPLIKRDRPGNWEVDRHQVRRPRTTSFPSGHASSAAAAATMLTDSVPRARVLWWSAATVVALSRIHTRMHHPSDVVVGAVVGRAIGLIGLRTPTPDPGSVSRLGRGWRP